MRNYMILCITLFLLSGCGKESSYEPVEIDPEVDVCEICNMSLTEEDYAAELLTKDGDVFLFDDLGCMMQFVLEEKRADEDRIAKQYVKDAELGGWIELETASFAYDPEFWTPMAYGVLAFETEEGAEAHIEQAGRGELLTYSQLKGHDWGWTK